MEAKTLADEDLEVGNGHRTEALLPDPTPSGLDELRAQREELIEDTETDLDIPGYGGKLVGRYERLEWETIAEIRRKAIRAAKRNPAVEPDVLASSNMLARACVGLFKRAEGKLVPLNELDPSLGEDPIRFADAALAGRALGFEAMTAREAISAILVHDTAIVLHAQELTQWIGESNAEIDEDF